MESLIFARKLVTEKKKKDTKIFVDIVRMLWRRGTQCRSRFYCSCSALIFLRDDIACSFIATINVNEHYRDLAALTGKSLLSFVLDTLKN